MGTPAGVLRVQASRCSSSSSRAWACSPRRSGPCGTSCARCSAATRPRPHPLALYLPWLCLPRLYVPWLYVPWLYVPWLWLCPPCPPRQANAEALQLIDSALFVLCLDDDAPPTPAAVARTMLHGTYAMNGDGVQVGSLTNRWYDKMQIIVCANGSAGVNFEHTSVDGHTVLPSASTLTPAPSPQPPAPSPQPQARSHTPTLTPSPAPSPTPSPAPSPTPSPAPPRAPPRARCSASCPTSSPRPSCASPPRSPTSPG